MSRVIYSLYIDIPEDDLDFFDKNIIKKDQTPTNINTKNQFKEHYNKIIDNKKRYAEINQEVTKLSVQFSQNLLAETNDFEIILDKEDLSGLTDDIIDLAKLEAENKFSKNKEA